MKKTLLFLVLFLLCINVNKSFAKAVETDWSEVDDVWVWGLHLNQIYLGDIVIFNGVMYQCIGNIETGGTFAYSYMWNPTAWEEPNYQEVAPVAAWESGKEFAQGDYVTSDNKLYRCLNAVTASAKPADAPADYEELANVIPAPVIEFPENFVAIWDDFNSWQPGFFVIYMEDENVYKCLKATDVMGEQLPGAENSEYWSESLGNAKDILSMTDVVIPEWDDLRIWIIGSVVKYEDKYYQALSQTHIGFEEFPGSTGGYWQEIDFATFGNQLPENFIGYWSDDMVWNPGYHAIYNGKVYECIAQTHKNGNEHPETTWGHWNNTPKGDESELPNIEGVTIPEWDDLRSWPVGSVVLYNGEYYRCLAKTTAGGGENPETPWGYWAKAEFTSINDIQVDKVAYYVDNGRLIVKTSSANVNVELYSYTGQLLGTSLVNNITLPNKGLYIAKITVDGKAVAAKIIW